MPLNGNRQLIAIGLGYLKPNLRKQFYSSECECININRRGIIRSLFIKDYRPKSFNKINKFHRKL